jgi:hypothetical protein
MLRLQLFTDKGVRSRCRCGNRLCQLGSLGSLAARCAPAGRWRKTKSQGAKPTEQFRFLAPPRRALIRIRPIGLNSCIYSPLIPAALRIGHHFSISALSKIASASGVCWSRGGACTAMQSRRSSEAGEKLLLYQFRRSCLPLTSSEDAVSR